MYNPSTTSFQNIATAGFYMLPVSSLHEPPAELLVRGTNEVFTAALKKEMMENPTGMSNILCRVLS